MGDEGTSSPPPLTQPDTTLPPPPTQSPHSDFAPNTDASPQARADLVAKARLFLASPQVVHQDASAKRKFLADKGLTEHEVDALLRELPPPVPQIPPRTYPPPPSSHLLNVLLGVVRLSSWLIGGSAVLVALYSRFLLPRLTQSHHARYSIRAHQAGLLRQFTTSLAAFKETQSECFSSLPRAPPASALTPDAAEDPQHQDCRTLDELLGRCSGGGERRAEAGSASETSLLRCAIQQLTAEHDGRPPNTDDIFNLLLAKVPWLTSPAGPKYQRDLWQVLSTSTLFRHEDLADESTALWSYVPPPPPAPPTPAPNDSSSLSSASVTNAPNAPSPPVLASLSTLYASLSKASDARRQQHSAHEQHAVQHTLAELASDIATRTYYPRIAATSAFRVPGMAMSGPGAGLGFMGPQEEEARREIRALKGLVLNRRSFMPRTAHSLSSQNPPEDVSA